jgi:transcriptional regulator with XRE-family HTH domain
MAKPYSTLRDKMSPEARAKAGEQTRILLQEMPLQELRQARRMSQEQMAKNLHTRQSNVSRIEKRTDMYISTLRSVIKAMGGDLEIVARFPDGSVRINQFEELDEALPDLFQGMSVDQLYEQAAASCAETSAEYKGKR